MFAYYFVWKHLKELFTILFNVKRGMPKSATAVILDLVEF